MCNREDVAAWREKNPDGFKRWREANLDRDREASRKWQQENRERVRVLVAERTSARKRRTPGWANTDRIREFYEIAAEMTRKTGIKHHVDHVMPLRGELVSGLHVHENLRVVTSAENLQKGNRWEP